VTLPGRSELAGPHIRPANASATSLLPQGICRLSSQLAVEPMMLRLGLFYVGDPHSQLLLRQMEPGAPVQSGVELP
jgi:hypothetical protein